MSGPKISIYEMTKRQKELMYGQLKCEQQGLVYGEQIKDLLLQCSGMEEEFNKALAVLELLQKRCGGEEEQIEEIKRLKHNIDQEIERIRSEFNRNTPRISSKYVLSEEALEKKKSELKKLVNIKNKSEALRNKLEKTTRNGKLVEKNVLVLESSIKNDIVGVLSFENTDLLEEETCFEERKNEVRDELLELLKRELAPQLTDRIRNAISTLDGITQIERLSTFNSITVKKIHREYEDYRMECEKRDEEFRSSLIRYHMLCDIAGKQEERKHTFSDNDELEKTIADLERIIVKQKEQFYIADCIDEVMQDMGYDLIGSRQVRKKSGKQFRNELYQFGEGTAVNVTYSPEGQITMELGGIAREDRIPTDGETTVLTQDMENFCGEFAEFEKRMKAKGIIVGKRIQMQPPTADYAAIINISEYDVEPGKQIAEMNVSTKRMKTSRTQHVLRRSE